MGIIGSRKTSINDDYGSGSWHLLAPNLTIYGFDADFDACETANTDLEARQVSWQEKHILLVLSSSNGESSLYVTEQLSFTALPYLE